MPDFNVRSDSVNVEQIMDQIRARIREKRGVDYTEQQIHELAAVKLEKFLDPRGVRSDLLDQFRKAQPAYEPPKLPNFAFEDATLFESHRAPIRWIRTLLMPLLKLLFNPNPLIQALHIQSRLNTMNAEREARRESSRRAMDQLYYELVHNLVIETTRTGIEVKNLKMRVESLASRLEFNERRARALESAVVYRPSNEEPAERPSSPEPASRPRPSQPPPRQGQPAPRPSQPVYNAPSSPGAAGPSIPSATPGTATDVSQTPSPGGGPAGEGPGQRSRRRRRRRGRRGGASAAAIMGAPAGAPSGGLLHAPAPADDGGPDGADDGSNVAEHHEAEADEAPSTRVEPTPPVEPAPPVEHAPPEDSTKPDSDPQ